MSKTIPYEDIQFFEPFCHFPGQSKWHWMFYRRPPKEHVEEIRQYQDCGWRTARYNGCINTAEEFIDAVMYECGYSDHYMLSFLEERQKLIQNTWITYERMCVGRCEWMDLEGLTHHYHMYNDDVYNDIPGRGRFPVWFVDTDGKWLKREKNDRT